jgi:hypothetical protein
LFFVLSQVKEKATEILDDFILSHLNGEEATP